MSRLFYGRRIWTPSRIRACSATTCIKFEGWGCCIYVWPKIASTSSFCLCVSESANIDFNPHKPSVRFMGHRQIVKIQIRHRMIGNGLGTLIRVVKSIQSKWVNWLQQYQAASQESLILRIADAHSDQDLCCSLFEKYDN